jgi:hypothetical protein
MLADKIAIYRSEIGNIPSNMDLHKLPFFLWAGWTKHWWPNPIFINRKRECLLPGRVVFWTTDPIAWLADEDENPKEDSQFIDFI